MGECLNRIDKVMAVKKGYAVATWGNMEKALKHILQGISYLARGNKFCNCEETISEGSYYQTAFTNTFDNQRNGTSTHLPLEACF